MALTTTVIVTSQATTAGGSPFQPTQLALQAATNAVAVTAKVVAAATPSTQGSKLHMYVATSPENITGAPMAKAFGRSAQLKICDLPFCQGGATQILQSDPIVVNGGYLYVWFDCPAYLGNLTATAVETTV
jgi:hypothetical protein